MEQYEIGMTGLEEASRERKTIAARKTVNSSRDNTIHSVHFSVV